MNSYQRKKSKRVLFRNLDSDVKYASLLSGAGGSLVSVASSNTNFLISNLKDALRIDHLLGGVSRDYPISVAWKLERILVKIGGGTRNWTDGEIIELLSTGKVRGYEGHHIFDVSNHPWLKALHKNIALLKGRLHDYNEHLLDGHKGNFANKTEGKFIDRVDIIRTRVILNTIRVELGILLTVAAISFLFGVVVSALKKPRESFKFHIKSGLSIAKISAITLIGGRACQIFLTPITEKIAIVLAKKFGEEVAKQVAGRLVFGIGSSIILSIITLARLKRAGHSWNYSLRQSGKVFIISMTSIIISIYISMLVKGAIAGGEGGAIAGPLGIVAGVLASIMFSTLIFLIDMNKRKMISYKLKLNENEGCYLLASRVK